MHGTIAFETARGQAIVGDAFRELRRQPRGICTLLLTSPPFHGPCELGTEPDRVVGWLLGLMRVAGRVISADGSIVIELAVTWAGFRNVRNAALFRFVSELCRTTAAAFFERCRHAGVEPESDRFPETLPAYFIDLLSDPSDLVIDPCAGTCATGAAAERLGRRWRCLDLSPEPLAVARLRFQDVGARRTLQCS
jgi:hypothetical protein